MVYVVQVCWQLARKLSTNLYDIYHRCLQWKTPDGGQRNCPKHVEFYSKNKIWEISAYGWFYYKNLSRCAVTWTSNSSNIIRLICQGGSDGRGMRHVRWRSACSVRVAKREGKYLYIKLHVTQDLLGFTALTWGHALSNPWIARMQFSTIPLRLVLVRCEVWISARLPAGLSFFFLGFGLRPFR